MHVCRYYVRTYVCMRACVRSVFRSVIVLCVCMLLASFILPICNICKETNKLPFDCLKSL